MKIAVLSDTHSRYATVAKALQIIKERAIIEVIHCGDIEDAETIELFQGLKAHFVYGNCDLERLSLARKVEDLGLTLHESWGNVEIEGVKIAFLHGHDKQLMEDVENSGYFDFLFYGHTHKAAEHRTGPTHVINPGALHRANPKTFVILDVPGGEIERVEVQ